MVPSPHTHLKLLVRAVEKYRRLHRNFDNFQRNHPNYNTHQQAYANRTHALAVLEQQIRILLRRINATHHLNMRLNRNLNSMMNNAMYKLVLKIHTVNNIARRSNI